MPSVILDKIYMSTHLQNHLLHLLIVVSGTQRKDIFIALLRSLLDRSINCT